MLEQETAAMRGSETKDVRLREFKLAGKAGTFSGYGSVFNNVDSYGDVIAPGAFAATLKDWRGKGKLPPMLEQHGGWGVSASDMTPIGVWTDMREDDHGLYVEGQLLGLETDRGKMIHEAMKSGALDGLSIGYSPTTVRYGEEDGEPDRTLLEVRLWEVSPVTFPANEEARVLQVKSADKWVDPREVERALRPLMSRSLARYWASMVSSAPKLDAPTRATRGQEPNRCDAGEDSERELEQKVLQMIGAMGAAIVQS